MTSKLGHRFLKVINHDTKLSKPFFLDGLTNGTGKIRMLDPRDFILWRFELTTVPSTSRRKRPEINQPRNSTDDQKW